MNAFTKTQEQMLCLLAVIGLIVPNGVFIYFATTRWDPVIAALTNPVSLVFIVEAFALMFLFAWLIRRQRLTAPGGLAFIAMSLLGSMMFSVPACLWLWSRKIRSRRSADRPSTPPTF